DATSDLSRELGTEVTLEDLHPKTFIRKHLISDEEQAELRRPFEELAKDVRGVGNSLNEGVRKPVEEALRTPVAPEESKPARPTTPPHAPCPAEGEGGFGGGGGRPPESAPRAPRAGGRACPRPP